MTAKINKPAGEQPESQDSPGLHLEVQHQKSKLEIRLSEKVAEALAPPLLVCIIVGGGLWLWQTYKPPGAANLPIADTNQPQK
jgi:hypothetical protein